MSAISETSAAGSFNMNISEALARAAKEDPGAHPAKSWQQAAGVFSAIANMLSAELATHEPDRQSRTILIQKIDELETMLRDGGSVDDNSLKDALARLESELRVWHRAPRDGDGCWQDPGRQPTGGRMPSQFEGTQSEADAVPLEHASPSLAGPVTDGSGKETAAFAQTLKTVPQGTCSDFQEKGGFDRCSKAGELHAEERERDEIVLEPPVRDASPIGETILDHGETKGLLEQLGHLVRDVQDSLARPEVPTAHRPLTVRRGAEHRAAETFSAPGVDPRCLDALTKQIEASHRQLAARLEAGLAAATAGTDTLKDLIAGAAAKIKHASEAEQSQRAAAALEREIANLSERLDHAGEGFAALTSLEHAIGGLSAQLEESRRIASGLSGSAGDEPHVGRQISASGDEHDTKIILREIADLRALHEDTWQRVHAVLTEIQDSVGQIAEAARSRGGLHAPQFVHSTQDPFAPILSDLARQRHDGSLALKARPGDHENFMVGKAVAGNALQDAGSENSGEAADAGTREAAAASLIEPGLGFPGRGEDRQLHGQSGMSPKVPTDREEGASRTDFIAAARRAARMAQRELQGAAAKSLGGHDGMGHDGMGFEGVAVVGAPSFQRSLDLLLHYKRPLVLAGALSLAAAGAFALARTPPHSHFSDFVPAFLKQLDQGAIPAKPAAAREPSANLGLADQSQSKPQPASQSRPIQNRTSETDAGQAPAVAGLAATGAATLDPLAAVDPHYAANGTAGNPVAARNLAPPAMRAIAGSDAIVADTLGRSNVASISARPRPAAAPVPANDLQEPASASAPAAGTLAAPAAAEPVKNLLEEASSGDAAAQFALAVRYAEGSGNDRNYELAAQWYGKAAEQGHAVAEYRLASFYERGIGVPQDMQRAKNLYQRAAEKGNTRAMHNLGVLAVEGNDGKPNYTSAALWFGKAAEYGVRDSEYNIAVLLARGLGVPKDLVKSYTWFAIIASAGDADAAKKRDEVAARLTSSELAAANAAAAAFSPRPADSAANETAAPAAHREAAPAAPGQPATRKVSGL